MEIAVPTECVSGERRVALTPGGVAALVGAGHRVLVQSGAGAYAQCPDAEYRRAGAEVVAGPQPLGRADVVLKVRAPLAEASRTEAAEIDRLRPGATLIGLLDPLRRPELADQLARRGIRAFSLDLIPRLARAQAMDALSSMSTVAGYRAAVLGAALCGRFFPLLMTAAGTQPPARVLVLGAGVAGLQAIATARRLGAVVSAYDTRAAARQQVESLGASFLGLPLAAAAEAEGGYAAALAATEQSRERELLAQAVARADVVITTALIPGAAAPLLLTREMVGAMHPGAVVVDLAAEAGGNCALTVPGERTVVTGVVIDGACGPWDLPHAASGLYSGNVVAFLRHLLGQVPDAVAGPVPTDPILQATCITWGSRVVHPAVAGRLAQRPVPAPEAPHPAA